MVMLHPSGRGVRRALCCQCAVQWEPSALPRLAFTGLQKKCTSNGSVYENAPCEQIMLRFFPFATQCGSRPGFLLTHCVFAEQPGFPYSGLQASGDKTCDLWGLVLLSATVQEVTPL